MTSLLKVIRSVALCAGATVLALGAAVAMGVAGLAGVPQAGAAAPPTTLGGFSVSALGEASTVQYEQPNFPLPATPSLEFDEGYADTTDTYGPSGKGLASVLWPGQVVANAGPNLPTFEPGVPLPQAPVWPVQAASTYPNTPTTSMDQPGVTMTAASGQGGSTAVAREGNAPASDSSSCAGTDAIPGLPGLPSLTSLGGSGTPSPATGIAESSILANVQSSSSTSSSTTAGGVATATATATDSCVKLLGGLVTLGSVSSTATATSNGTVAKLAGSTTVSGASVAGEPVTIDSSGIHAAGASTPANTALSTIESMLTDLGITMTVTNATDTVKGPAASRLLDGLTISINLTTFDQQADKFSALLPATLTSKLPVPAPTKQVLTWDLGVVDVHAAASPAFVATAAASTASGGGAGTAAGTSTVAPQVATGAATGGTASTAGTVATPGSTGGTYGTAGTPGTAGTAGGSGGTPGGATGGTGGTTSHPADDASSVVPAAFKGIGAGLILLGLLAAGGLAFATMRANTAAEALADGAACADPGADGFSDPGGGFPDGPGGDGGGGGGGGPGGPGGPDGPDGPGGADEAEGIVRVWSDALS